MCRMAERSAGK